MKKMSENHRKMVNDICFMVIPTSHKLQGATAGPEQAQCLSDVFKKLAYPTAVKVLFSEII